MSTMTRIFVTRDDERVRVEITTDETEGAYVARCEECGGDLVADTRERWSLADTIEASEIHIDHLHARPLADDAFRPRFPEGTPEYDAYAAELRTELAKFAKGEDPYPYEGTGPMSDTPEWLAPGTAVVHLPRRRTELAEAWPVAKVRLTTNAIVVTTESGEEIRFIRETLRPLGIAGALAPVLLSATDSRAVAAAERTEVMRVTAWLSKAIARHRPERTKPTAEILAGLRELAAAAQVAYEDVAALTSPAHPEGSGR